MYMCIRVCVHVYMGMWVNMGVGTITTTEGAMRVPMLKTVGTTLENSGYQYVYSCGCYFSSENYTSNSIGMSATINLNVPRNIKY
jgi:hypothetical protein